MSEVMDNLIFLPEHLECIRLMLKKEPATDTFSRLCVLQRAFDKVNKGAKRLHKEQAIAEAFSYCKQSILECLAILERLPDAENVNAAERHGLETKAKEVKHTVLTTVQTLQRRACMRGYWNLYHDIKNDLLVV